MKIFIYKFLLFSFLLFFSQILPADITTPKKNIKVHDQHSMMQLIEELLEGNDVDINTTDVQGRTLLMWAVEMGKKEATYLLIQEGADVNVSSLDDTTALI